MTARFIQAKSDPIARETPAAITITVDGVEVHGFLGQTLAGMMLATGALAWRRTSFGDRSRGAFCGIGICFDCLVVVNGQRDVRACQR
ncbi:MAG: (2Fe-2S)-binding protein, partial [Acidimicrobiales bacterium]